MRQKQNSGELHCAALPLGISTLPPPQIRSGVVPMHDAQPSVVIG